jgi:hypothetical protein
MSNFIEQLREVATQQLLSTTAFQQAWPTRSSFFASKLPPPSLMDRGAILQLGEHLSPAMRLVGRGVRTQSGMSSGGKVWEALVTWYLNLCLAGTEAVCIKRGKLSPQPIVEALSVVYQNTVLKDESDVLIVSLKRLANLPPVRSTAEMRRVLNREIALHFNEVGVINIQCKTNWNDNAQVPMLWNMLYNQARKGAVIPNGFTIGRNGFSLMNLGHFGYAFATVPTQKKAPSGYKANSIEVLRVRSMSAGNYWGYPTNSSVCSCLSEIFNFFTHNSAIFPNVSTVGLHAAAAMKTGVASSFRPEGLLFPTQ